MDWHRSLSRIVILAGMALASSVPATALAHPLGNFTVNRYSRVEVEPGTMRVFYVLDVAEIPAFQERQAADTDRDGTVSEPEWEAYKARKVEEIRRGLELTLDGARVQLEVEQSGVSTPPGQANLLLLRVEAWFRAAWFGEGEHRARLRDLNEPTRIGWREIVVRPGPGAAIHSSSVPGEDVSDELRAYPEDLLRSPLDRREAEWAFTAGAPAASTLPAVLTRDSLARPADAFTALITAQELNVGIVLLALLASALLGGIHAASPGHGKTVMAAYIVGTRGTLFHAAALALAVTISHTAGVLALAAITLFASHAILPEQLYPWLTLASGLIVVIIGAGLLLRAARLRGAPAKDGHEAHHHHAHNNGHSHGHDHGRGHRHDLPITWRNLFALGLAGGIVPSASALVVLLSALALGRLGFGLALIVAFGAGMAVVLTAAGVLVVYAGRLAARLFPNEGSPLQRALTRAIPFASAGAMVLVGLVVTIQALGQFGPPWA